MEQTQTLPRTRNKRIDEFRGATIMLMVIANYIGNIHGIPAWLKHPKDIGLTIIDFIAPLFMLAVALSLRTSVVRRIEHSGRANTTRHILSRAFALIGIGTLFSSADVLFSGSHSPLLWGVLQAIGASIAIAYSMLSLHWLWRITVATLLLIGYQFGLEHGWQALVLASSHGGIYAALSWTALLLLFTVIVELYDNRQHARLLVYAVSLLFIIFGILLAYCGIPISKARMTISFVFLVAGLCPLVYIAYCSFVNIFSITHAGLSMWGKNSLVLFGLHGILIGAASIPKNPAIYTHAKGAAILLGLAICFAVLHTVAFLLDKHNKIISL